MQPLTFQPESRLPHALAVVLVCATFPLIWVGGMVTTYEAGMAVPDWPTTYGYNLFLYPWQTWVSGSWYVFIEHGHRLFGAVVGLATIAAMLAVWCCDRRRWLRFYSVALLAAVIGQGVLGGMRVRLDERLFAKIHACTGPLFFAMCVALAVFTSRYWRETVAAQLDVRGGKLHRLATITAGLAYVQIVLGAQLRHLTLGVDPGALRTFVLFHILVALAVTVHVVLLARCVGAAFRQQVLLRRPAQGLVALIIAQLGLGVGTWVMNYGWPVWFQGYSWAERHVVVQQGVGQSLTTTAHVAVGSLILVTSVMLALRSFRLVRSSASSVVARPTMLGVTA